LEFTCQYCFEEYDRPECVFGTLGVVNGRRARNTEWNCDCSWEHKYCSHEHYIASKSRRCVVCGESFLGGGAASSMCSPECSRKRLGQLRANNPEQNSAACDVCGKSFIKGNRQQKRCSVECRKKYQEEYKEERGRVNGASKSKTSATCKVCGEVFVKNCDNHKICSDACRKTLKEVTHFDVFKRDGFRCQYCGKIPADGVRLVVDHIYPTSLGGEGDYHNLITACEDCNGCKSNKLLPLQLTFEFWSASDGSFSYSAAKEYWERDANSRRNR